MTEYFVTEEKEIRIYPKLPKIDGIFNLGSYVLIASHRPHERIKEHLHDHLYHMHIRYGFEIPQQSFRGIDEAALQVAMLIQKDQRVDCNPIFVGKGKGAEGVCLKIRGNDVHWVHDESVGKKATKIYEENGRKIPPDFRFIGFSTSDLEERKIRRYSKEELIETVGFGLKADQHFQATWITPKDEVLTPYDVIIFLSDDQSNFYTFFNLPVTVSLGAY